MEKVFKTDSHSAMAIAGAAGPCIEMARLFSIELEHYEKLDGVPLSCVGKANRLGHMVKANLPMAKVCSGPIETVGGEGQGAWYCLRVLC